MFGTNAFGWPYFGEGYASSGLLGTDSGTATEIAFVGVAVSDFNGATSEITPPPVVLIVAADSGSAAEQASIGITVSDPVARSYAGLPSEFATYAAIPAQIASYAALPYYAPYPTATETATVSFTAATADVNGATSESAAVEIRTLYVVSDSGTSSEMLKLAFATFDAGTGSDTAALKLLLSEQGLGTESAKLGFTLADSGIASEAAALTTHYFLFAADANGPTDEVAQAATAVLLEADQNFSTVEATRLTITSADQGSGLDEGLLLAQTVVVSDASGPVTETLLLGRPVEDANSSATEIAQATVSVSTADLNSLSYEFATIGRLSVVADALGGAESAAVATILLGTDQGTSLGESASTGFPALLEDVGHSLEDTSLSARLLASDTGISSEFALIRSTTPVVADAGVGSEAWTLALRVAEIGYGLESASAGSLLVGSDSNSVTIETGIVRGKQTIPPGAEQMLTAVDGVDVTRLTAVYGSA